MMKLGFVSAILPDLPLEQVFQFAQQTGYQSVELMCWPVGKAERRYAGVTHLDVANLTPQAVDNALALSKKYQVEISALGYYPNPLAGDADEAAHVIEHIKNVITASAELGVGIANTFIGRDPGISNADNWARVDQRWPNILEHAASRQVRIGIENCPMFFSEDEWPAGKNLAVSPSAWHELFKRLDSPYLGLNYDPSHLVWQMMDYLSPLREFSDRIFHVHAKDVRLDRHGLDQCGILATPLSYHSPKLPGLGEIDWGAFFATLGDNGYAGHVCVEVEDRAYEGSLASRQAALRQCQRYLGAYLPLTYPPKKTIPLKNTPA